MTAQDKTRLMELHKVIGSAAEEVLKDKGESNALKDIVKKITALSSGSYQALLQYDPAKEPKTLSSLEEEVRTLTIHQGSVLLGGAETLGGAQSERVPCPSWTERATGFPACSPRRSASSRSGSLRRPSKK